MQLNDHTVIITNGEYIYDVFASVKRAEQELEKLSDSEMYVSTMVEYMNIHRKHWLTDAMPIDEEEWIFALEMKPLQFTQTKNVSYFFMREFMSGTITHQFIHSNGKYYMQAVDYADKSTWHISTKYN